MHTYLINLARRPDRLAQMEPALKALDLPHSVIEAIDGTDDRDIGQPVGHPMSKPAYACYLSHIKAYRAFLDSGAAHGVIMEDDVALSPRLPKALGIAGFFQDQNAILRLEGPTNFHWNIPSLSKNKAEYIQNGFASYQLVSKSSGTGAFVISRMVAERMVTKYADPEYPIDLRLFHLYRPNHPKFKILQICPALALQNQFVNGKDDSDIRHSKPSGAYNEDIHPMLQNMSANVSELFHRLTGHTPFVRSFPFAEE